MANESLCLHVPIECFNAVAARKHRVARHVSAAACDGTIFAVWTADPCPRGLFLRDLRGMPGPAGSDLREGSFKALPRGSNSTVYTVTRPFYIQPDAAGLAGRVDFSLL